MHENDIPGCSCQFIHPDINAFDSLAVGHKTMNMIVAKGGIKLQTAKP